MEKADDVRADPDNGADNDDEKNDEEGGKRGPHRFLLPGRRIFVHANITPLALCVWRRRPNAESTFWLLERILLCGRTFAHRGTGALDLLRQLLVLRIERHRLLPCFQRLG